MDVIQCHSRLRSVWEAWSCHDQFAKNCAIIRGDSFSDRNDLRLHALGAEAVCAIWCAAYRQRVHIHIQVCQVVETSSICQRACSYVIWHNDSDVWCEVLIARALWDRLLDDVGIASDTDCRVSWMAFCIYIKGTGSAAAHSTRNVPPRVDLCRRAEARCLSVIARWGVSSSRRSIFCRREIVWKLRRSVILNFSDV